MVTGKYVKTVANRISWSLVSVNDRGKRGDDIFTNREDYQLLIALLQETSAMFDIKISAYCLMSNQYHLLVQTPAAHLSRSMRHINGVYTQRYNRRKNIDGQLFRGRYKCVLVEEDSHLLEILRYIHRNTLRANMCTSAGGKVDVPVVATPASR
jgi:REP-associated tyrosine transposase